VERLDSPSFKNFHGQQVFNPTNCSIKISQDLRDYAAEQGVSEQEALTKGMQEKAIEFVKKGSEVYQKV